MQNSGSHQTTAVSLINAQNCTKTGILGGAEHHLVALKAAFRKMNHPKITKKAPGAFFAMLRHTGPGCAGEPAGSRDAELMPSDPAVPPLTQLGNMLHAPVPRVCSKTQ